MTFFNMVTKLLDHQSLDVCFFQFAAEIEIHPNKEFVYVSNRGTGAVVVFKIKDDNSLEFVQVDLIYQKAQRM